MFLFSMRDDWPQFLTYLDGMELTKPQSWKGHRKRLFPSQHVLIVLAHGCLFDVPSTFLWWFGTWMDDFSSSLCEFTRGYLVGGDWNHGIWIDFPYFSIGNVIIPTDELTPSFFRGIGQTPTSDFQFQSQASHVHHHSSVVTEVGMGTQKISEKWDLPGEIWWNHL